MSQEEQNNTELENNIETIQEGDDVTSQDEPENKWMIRECGLYKEEYKECTSFRGRFHQYFIFGETLNCNQWKKDYDNCCKWEDNRDIKAAEAVINSEKTRRLQRFKDHYRNDTWKKREAPPTNWNNPLPEWMAKRDENTYLAQKAKEISEGKVEDSKSFCVVM